MNKKLTEEMRRYYWDSLPTDENAAVSYNNLVLRWNVERRTVRRILADLSAWDSGDDFILIRSAHNGGGFFKTSDVARIIEYRAEVYNRALNTMRPLKKIRRVLGSDKQVSFDDLIFFEALTGGEI